MLPPFPGFTPDAFAFLRALAVHNDRAWFQPRKAMFDAELRDPLVLFVATFLDEARRRGLPFTGQPEKAVFRLYRDTRFSKDKRPYKTHLGAWLTPSGDKAEPGGFYVHIEPDRVFCAVGYWGAQGADLRRLRQRFADDVHLGDDLTARMAAVGARFESEEALKRMPQGFEAYADTPAAPFLRWKHFLAILPFAEADTYAPSWVQTAADFAEAAMPVLDLGR